jgi:CotH kinase protein/Secretion system C-terminal sorting domain
MIAIRTCLLFICIPVWMFSNAQSFTSSNLPIISINTNGQTISDEPKITADMGIIYNGSNIRNNITDAFNHYNGKIGIEIRGQSSQMFPMKSYSIELRNSAGASTDKSLFGLPKESDWVLYAPYTDKTMMRNFLAYTMSREMGHWAANCRYVEVILNGQYIGIYIFMEKLKRNSGRVNIPKMAATDITGDAVTGGYIFSIDKQPDGWYSAYKTPNSSYNQQIRYSYVYPKITDIVPEQQNYIKSYVDSFETALYNSNNPAVPNTWRNFADEPSFIDYFIVNEVSRNVDGYRLSAYFYKDRESKNRKIIAGPVWDYDLAFRNANYCYGSDTSGWAYNYNTVCPQDISQNPFWWNRFMQDANFRSNLRCRWKQLRQTSLSLTRLNTIIDSVYTLTEEARQRHFQKWPTLGQYIWPNPQPIATTYSGEISYLKAWIESRLTWIDRHLPNEGACYDYPSDLKESILIQGNPNPVRSNYYLTIKSRVQQQVAIRAIDAIGRVVYSTSYAANAGSNQMQIDMTRWQKGVYVVHFIAATGETVLQKIVKQ